MLNCHKTWLGKSKSKTSNLLQCIDDVLKCIRNNTNVDVVIFIKN